jgi:hypothetical protein
MQQNIEQAIRWPNEFAVYFDVILLVRLGTKVRANLAVDGNAACRDQLIAVSPRTDPGGGEKAI